MRQQVFGCLLGLQVAGVDRGTVRVVRPSPPDIDGCLAGADPSSFPGDKNGTAQSSTGVSVDLVMRVVERGAGAIVVEDGGANLRPQECGAVGIDRLRR